MSSEKKILEIISRVINENLKTADANTSKRPICEYSFWAGQVAALAPLKIMVNIEGVKK